MSKSAVTYTTTEADYSMGLGAADTPNKLRGFVESWMPYTADAVKIVKQMGEKDFSEWRAGLAQERMGDFAGEDFATRYCALLIPEDLMRGSILAKHFQVPLGCAMIQARNAKLSGSSAPPSTEEGQA